MHEKMTAVPIYGIGNLDNLQDWVTTEPSPLTPSTQTTGQCTSVTSGVTIIYQKFGRRNNFRYRINLIEYQFKSK
jgi:hypothetical protein